MNLHGKTALVTGGSSGIGLAAAKAFAAQGARVAILGRSEQALAHATAEIGGEVLCLVGDVRSRAALDAAALNFTRQFERLNILFANAGVAYGTSLYETSEDQFDQLMDINVKGVFNTVQTFSRLMGQGDSIILNTSWLAEVGTPGRSVLSASKAAVRSFTRTFAAELAPRGIRVNAVSPGPTATPIHGLATMSAAEAEDYVTKVGARVPIGRMGTTEDIAAAALFLASDQSAYMLGAEIAVDGGFSQL